MLALTTRLDDRDQMVLQLQRSKEDQDKDIKRLQVRPEWKVAYSRYQEYSGENRRSQDQATTEDAFASISQR